MVPTTMGGRPCGLPPIVFLGLLQALYNFVFGWHLLGMTLGWQSGRHALGSRRVNGDIHIRLLSISQ